MRILWVKAGGLWPLTAGGRIRSYHMLSELSARHAVTVLTTHAPGEEDAELATRLPRCASVASFAHAPAKRGDPRFAAGVARSRLSALPLDLWRWRAPALRDAATAALASGGFDVCVADFLSAEPNLPRDAGVPVVLFEHNVEYVIWRRLASSVPGWQRPLVEREWRRVRRYEARAVARVNLTVAVSERDRDLLAALAPGAAVRVVPTGVDTEYFGLPTGPEEEGTIAFVGSMDWYPNEDAALNLMDAILPLVRREVPGVRATLVGRNPSARLCAAAERAGVRVTGTVADVRPHVAEAAVLVVPIRVGGGTRLKLYEGLAMGKATVSTSIGAEGLPLVPGEHLEVADAPADFARAMVTLLRDPARRRTLGAAGRDLVAERHSWARATEVFEAHLTEAAGR